MNIDYMKISPFAGLSFRIQLAFAFGILTLLTLVAMGVVWGMLSASVLETSIKSELQGRAHSASELIVQALRDRHAEIVDLSQSAIVQQTGASSASIQEILDKKRSLKPEYAWIGVAAANGSVTAASGNMLVGKDVRQRDWFRLGQSSAWIGDVHEAVLLSRLMPREKEREPLRFIDISAPIQNSQGQRQGVLGAHLHWSWITRLAESVLPQDARSRRMEFYILDRNGVTLYPFSETGETSLKQDAELKGIAREIVWANGERYVTSQIGLPQTPEQHLGWRVVLRQPVAIAYESLHVFIMQMIGGTIGLALIAALLAYRIAAIMNAPIVLLAKAVENLGKNADQVFVPVNLPQELQSLSGAIEHASTQLTASRRELEKANELLEERVQERTRALGLANEALALQAMTDGLTTIANRRAFDSKLAQLHALSAHTGQAYGLLIIDADHFKHVNDRYGHHIGDRVLISIAEQINGALRATDFVARYGGEEFVVLVFPVAANAELFRVAEKIRQAVEIFDFEMVGNLTISVGASLIDGGTCEPEQALKLTDTALYQAKMQGRNRCVVIERATGSD